eukprot:TRINITY_DN75_c2_g1_i1.p1 TRINITY_DN75_c2_g1~~TRINITY_DN75_c2_g1_i1.p1  ORF type:complete len:245 (-),score=-19.53 TRINITY_DN75_c2_g1_i1:1463-2197(-)
MDHKLTIILLKKSFFSIQSYSKGAQGLSVPPQILRIFTQIANSLDQFWRQWESRYAIHAGQYLIDKEFRYLRTVRITAAVQQDLQSKHQKHFFHSLLITGQASDLIHHNNILQSPVFLLNSRYPLFCYTKHSYYKKFNKYYYNMSIPSPEVTELICRVPSKLLFQSPQYTLLIHLWRFKYGYFQLNISWKFNIFKIQYSIKLNFQQIKSLHLIIYLNIYKKLIIKIFQFQIQRPNNSMKFNFIH